MPFGPVFASRSLDGTTVRTRQRVHAAVVLIINTSTTIVTFLMVFLLQNTQNRDTAAIQLKLDELIRANQNARNKMLCLEDLSEDELKRVKATFESLAAAPAAAGQIRETTEQLKDAGDALHGAAAELHRAT
jgi:low affinity Fe/Cu permease